MPDGSESAELLKEIRDINKLHHDKMVATMEETKQWVLLRLMVPVWALLAIQCVLLVMMR